MGIGGEHAAALDVFGDLELLRRLPGSDRARGLHLRQAGEIGVAQHQADIGMSDEAPLRIDDVSLPALADLDLRYDVPNELEVDLGDAHSGIAARAGERQRHVRLRLAAKIDRAVIDLVRDRFGEFRLLGEVGLARDHVHRQARDPQLLATGRIELRELGDRGHLAQQPQPVKTPLIDGAGRPGQLRGPPDLALDLLDELTDLGCRRLRLLALDADEGSLVLLIGKPDFGQSVGEQGNADDGEKQADIFAKQPAARPPLLLQPNRRIGRWRSHSITSSYRLRPACICGPLGKHTAMRCPRPPGGERGEGPRRHPRPMTQMCSRRLR